MAEELGDRGLLLGTHEYLHGEAYHRLCGAQVRPRPTPVWFLRSEMLEAAARDLLAQDRCYTNDERWDAQVRAALEVVAGRRKDNASRWWEGACLAMVQDYSSNRDWILSRQNWWGYRVPAWHCDACRRVHVGEQRPRACDVCACAELTRDPDVLDVLFHSALWALMVGEDPQREPHADCAALGVDILAFWLPAAELWAHALYGKRSIGRALVHGMVCDSTGTKMSKSLGNALDLDDLLERHGSEGLRAAVYRAMIGRDGEERIPLDPAALAQGGAFAARLHAGLLQTPLHARCSAESLARLERAEEAVDHELRACRVGAAYGAVLELAEAAASGELHLDRTAALRLLRTLYAFHPSLTEAAARAHGLDRAVAPGA